MITPPPTPARPVKLRKKNTDSPFIYLFLFNYIILITIIWQNLGGREGRAYDPRVAVSLGGPPRVAVSLEATLH